MCQCSRHNMLVMRIDGVSPSSAVPVMPSDKSRFADQRKSGDRKTDGRVRRLRRRDRLPLRRITGMRCSL